MSVAHGAGPRAKRVRGATHPETDREWANVGAVDLGSADRVGEWIDLLARMSHDLRTPLNAVIGFSDAMQQELFGPIGNARYEEYVRLIRASGVELLQAAELALDMTAVLAQPRARSPEDLALAPLVAGAVEDLTERDRGLAEIIAIEVPADLVIRSDPGILAKAVRQLVAIAASRASPGARIAVAAASEHGLVELTVHVSEVADAPLLDERGCRPTHDVGLGRRDLGMWLAVVLLEMLDCRLSISAAGRAATLRTTLEEAIQRDFFPTGRYQAV